MQVEQLGKLERRVSLSLPVTSIEKEVESRLKRLSRTVRMAGFRPGKVPMKMVAQQYGYQVQNEVLNEQIGDAFRRAVEENQLRVAGAPNIEPRSGEGVPEGVVAFDATFEVYPEVPVGDLGAIEIEKASTAIGEAEIDKTVTILRNQRVHFHPKGVDGEHGAGGEAKAAAGDRITVDFTGTIDGVAFEGGTATDFTFVLGEGRMLPEFEAAATGLGPGESKTFALTFPADYQGKDVAGKTAQFELTVKRLEWAHLPEVDEHFARMLGIEDGDLARMRSDIRSNLEREVKNRLHARTRDAVLNALVATISDLDVPKALVDAEVQRQIEAARADLRGRGMTVPEGMQFPAELFQAEAARRVRVRLIVAELVKREGLTATPEQVKAHVEDLSQSYENPAEVVRWYYAERDRLSEVEALVLEENVINYVAGKAKVKATEIAFDELMGQSAR